MFEIPTGLVFDDVLLVPQYSEVESRSVDVSLAVDMSKGYAFKIPIISSNMKHITEVAMCDAIGEMGGLGILHRFCSIEQQAKMFRKCSYKNNVGGSIGIKEKDKDLATALIKAGCNIICIDVAHGHSKQTGEMTNWIHKNYPDVLLLVGNVATKKGAEFLLSLGADVVKNGIGNGSICTTRINAGSGYPLLSSLYEASQAGVLGTTNDYPNRKIVSDGGCRNSGDIVKALCFADMVMTGNILAGTDETPGEVITIDGKKYKEYAGSSTLKSSYIEGVAGMIPYKGSVQKVIENILEGVRSGCSYSGAHNLTELKQKAKFVRMTGAGLTESKAHDIIIKQN